MSLKRTNEEIIDLASSSSSEEDEAANDSNSSSPRRDRKRARQQLGDDDDEDTDNHNSPAVARRSQYRSQYNVNEAIARGTYYRRGPQRNSNNNNQRVEEEIIDLSLPSPPVAAAAAAAASSSRGMQTRQQSVARSHHPGNYYYTTSNAIYNNSSSGNSNSNNNNNNNNSSGREWSCQRCTLKNSYNLAYCAVCRVTAPHFRTATITNDSDQDDSDDNNDQQESPFSMARQLGYNRRIMAVAASAQAAAASLSRLHGIMLGINPASNHFLPPGDYMNYTNLLETFGDGSENRNNGASSSTISSLPVNKLQNVEEELPDGKRTCNICLEDYEAGDCRKSLPCLHGFHDRCIDQWLGLNAVCPVCKTPVSD